ncbi:hypothetical protein [Actinomadura flavalba]|uniref:hypothetical protein n=1 Tax=Actinomadura flavalba TaxID=1120938 RepID=UPI00037C3982|nr:hypothetical protein [Actinomadura flavalba]
MSTQTKVIIGGVGVGLLLFWLLPNIVATLIILGLVAVPVVGYLMLDPSQRRRLRAQGRKRIGS